MRFLVDILRADKESRTAADVVTANPGKFSSEAKVPKHLYLSLRDLLYLPVGADTDDDYEECLEKFIVEDAGSQEGDAERRVNIYALIDEQSKNIKSMRRADTDGAKTAQIVFHAQIPRDANSEADRYTVRDIQLRIWHLIDKSCLAVQRKNQNLCYAYEDIANACSDNSMYLECTDYNNENDLNIVLARRLRDVKAFLRYEYAVAYAVDFNNVCGA